MACSLTISGRALPCREALGGIKNVWFSTDGFADGDWGTPTAGAFADTAVAVTVKNFVSPKNTSSFTQTVNASVENGTVFFEQVVSLVCNNPSASDIVEIQELAKGRLLIIIEDVNGNFFAVGHTRGAELTGGSVMSGTAIGDLNGFTLEFTAQEAIPAPFAPAASATNLTYTAV